MLPMALSTPGLDANDVALVGQGGPYLVVRGPSGEVLARFAIDSRELHGVLGSRLAFQATDGEGTGVALEASGQGIKVRHESQGVKARNHLLGREEVESLSLYSDLVYNCAGESMKPRTILVVEDDANDEKLTLRALRSIAEACSVVVARSGGDALDFLLRRGEFAGRQSADPDVMFLDNSLPGIPGDELVRRIRAEETLRKVPLVVFSGSSDQSLVQNCLAAGANEFVEKPVDMVDYLTSLRCAAERWLSVK